MDLAYASWLFIAGIGAVAGFFVSPRTIVLLCAVLLGIAIVGLIAAGAASNSPLAWVFGIAAMAVPALGAVAAVGAAIGAAVRKGVRRGGGAG